MSSIVSPDGRYSAQLQNDGNFVVYRHDGAAIGSTGQDPNPLPDPPPAPLTPLVYGNWSGNVLHRSFFGPAIAARPEAERRAYFADQAAQGYTHVLINAEQADWGPSKGHPEWTAGGVDAYAGTASMLAFRAVLVEAREAGLSPCVGVVDQPSLKAYGVELAITRSRELVAACGEHICLYKLSWELEEVWGNGDVREPKIEQWMESVDRGPADVGVHYADGMHGSIDFYNRLGEKHSGADHTVRLMQYRAEDDDAELRRKSRLLAEYHASSQSKVCAEEHSSEVNQNPTYTEARRRAAICLEELSKHLPSDRMGSLNG